MAIIAKPKNERLGLLEFGRIRSVILVTILSLFLEILEYVSHSRFSTAYHLGIFALIGCMCLCCVVFYMSLQVQKNFRRDATRVVQCTVMLLYGCSVHGIILLKMEQHCSIPVFYVLIGSLVGGFVPTGPSDLRKATHQIASFFVKCIVLLCAWTYCLFPSTSNGHPIIVITRSQLFQEMIPVLMLVLVLLVWQFEHTIAASAATWRMQKRSSLLQLILDSSDSVVWQCDSNVNIKNFFGNYRSQFAHMTGPDISAKSRSGAFYTAEEIKSLEDAHRKVIETGESRSFVYTKRPGSDRTHSWSIKLSPMRSGSQKGVVGVGLIVDDLITAQERQKQSEQLYQVLVNSISDNIIQLDRNGKILFVNRLLFERGRLPCDQDGSLTVESSVGVNFFTEYACFGDEYRQTIVALFKEVISTNSERTHEWAGFVDGNDCLCAYTLGNQHEQAAAGTLFFSTRLVPVVRNGQVDTVILMTQDITERFNALEEKRKAEEARIACNAKGSFLSTLSHELRNPLMISIASVEALLLSDPSSLNEEQREHASNALNSSRHLLGILNDVMQAEKISAGMTTIHLESVDVIGLVESSVQSMGNQVQAVGQAQSKDILMLSYVDPRLPRTLRLDRLHLNQVFINMLGNAIKFTQSGFVCLSAKLVSEEADGQMTVAFTCADSGCGIKAEDQHKVFEPFQQIEDGTRRLLPSNYAGFGLGMALSRTLIEHMGGTLTLESTYGKGTTFTAALGGVSSDNSTQRVANELQSCQSRYNLAYVSTRCEKLVQIVSSYLQAMHIKVGNLSDNADLLFVDADSEQDVPRAAGAKIIKFQKNATSPSGTNRNLELAAPIRINKLLAALESSQKRLTPGSPIEPKLPRVVPEIITRAKTILICEDVKIIQKLLLSFLGKLGFNNVVCADDGQHGVEEFSKHDIGLVFMDLQMPRLDGIEATRKIREIEEQEGRHRSPVICLTANDKQQTLEQCTGVGFSTIVNKPCTIQDLYDAITHVFEKQKCN